jgi:esterase FrsA
LEAGNPLLASFAYGFAKFPCLANDARRKAQQNQLETYLKAAPSFPVKFERRMLALPYQGGSEHAGASVLSNRQVCNRARTELQWRGGYLQNGPSPGLPDFGSAPRRYGLAYDIPGTGESPVSLSLKGDEIVLGIVNEAEDRRREGRVSRIFLRRKLSAMTGLSGAVDAAIVNGGPVDKAEDACLEAPAR